MHDLMLAGSVHAPIPGQASALAWGLPELDLPLASQTGRAASPELPAQSIVVSTTVGMCDQLARDLRKTIGSSLRPGHIARGRCLVGGCMLAGNVRNAPWARHCSAWVSEARCTNLTLTMAERRSTADTLWPPNPLAPARPAEGASKPSPVPPRPLAMSCSHSCMPQAHSWKLQHALMTAIACALRMDHGRGAVMSGHSWDVVLHELTGCKQVGIMPAGRGARQQ